MRMEPAFLRADGCSKRFILELHQRENPTLQALEWQQSLVRDHREVFPTDDEENEQAPTLNQGLEEKSTSTQSSMIEHVKEESKGHYTGNKGWGQDELSGGSRLHTYIRDKSLYISFYFFYLGLCAMSASRCR